MTKIDFKKLQGLYGVLYNSYRLRIIALCERKPHTVADISRSLGLSYSITVKYVGLLAEAGFVKKARQSNGTVLVKSTVRLSQSGFLKRI